MDEKEQVGNKTFSAKVAPELKDSLERMKLESGKSYDEFLSSLVATYETAQHRESVSDIRELNQLKTFIARIEEVYVSMAKSRKDVEESSLASVTALQDELRAVKAELHDIKKISADEVAEARKEAEWALTESINAKELKDRAEKQADAMTSTVEQQKYLVTQLEETASKAKLTAENAISELTSFKSEFVLRETELQELRNQIKFQVPAEIEKAKVEVLKESANEIKALHDRIEALQNDKLKLTESLAQEREKVIKLESKPVTTNKKAPPKKVTKEQPQA